ncbi:MAG TPA: PQQ-binding-like beta-propeller repeat protein [Candidatus Acidoferrales bacterium]|nr:PQQ-binding-like beta-propeller repeat protein [Candidatus Acidoferrales bacterium]
MRSLSTAVMLALAGVCGANAQLGRSIDVWTYGGDAQRTGWVKTDGRFTKDEVNNFQLLYKVKLEEQPKGVRSLTPPTMIGILISYRGFKELAFVGGSSDNFYAINSDLGKLFFHRPLTYSSEIPKLNESSGPCGSGVTVMAMLKPNAQPNFGGGRGAAGRGGPPPPPAPVPLPADSLAARGGRGGFGGSRPIFVLSSDGRLHWINTANGDDSGTPVKWVPPNARVGNLNLADNIIYTTTNQGCGGVPNAVWSIDLNGAEGVVKSWASNGGGFWGVGGVALGADNTVYAQTGDGPFDPSSNKWSNTVVALNPKNLTLKSYFTPPNLPPDPPRNAGANTAPARNVGMNSTSPLVFTYKGREMIVSAAKDGRLYLLDAPEPGGSDHHTFVSRTAPVGADAGLADRGIWGGLSTWEDTDGTRWILAPVWGPVSADLKAALSNGAAPNGSIVAFKVEEQSGKPALTPAWVSRDMSSPEPPAVANGVVFALSAGEHTRQVKEGWGGYTADERPKAGTHATLYALDAATGNLLYSSKDSITAPAALTGITFANGRVFFGTTDGTFYAFGMYMEH